MQATHIFFRVTKSKKQQRDRGVGTVWQRKPKLDKPQVLSAEGAVGNDATAVTWAVWPESDR